MRASLLTSFLIFYLANFSAWAQQQKLGIVLGGRNDVSADAYQSLVQKITDSLQPNKQVVSVVLPQQFTENNFDSALSNLASQGVSTNQIFVIAHSMSSAGDLLTKWVNQNSGKVGGLILLQAFLQRNYRADVASCIPKANIQPHKSLACVLGCLKDGAHDCYGPNTVQFPVQTLTIGGELDGVVRVTRIAEAYYTQTLLSKSAKDFVFVVNGMNHGSLLSSALPASVLQSDLKAEITPDNARAAVAAIITAFVNRDSSALQKLQSNSATFFAPIVDAFVNQEGSWWFTGSDEEHGASSWAASAQELMARPLPDPANGAYSFKTKNEFHLLSDEEKIPPYFRQKHRPAIDLNNKVIETTSISQLRFIKLSTLDTAAGLNGNAIIKEEKSALLSSLPDDGSTPVSAIEIGTKLASRQFVFNQTGLQIDAPDSVDTDQDRCKAINQAAYNWALQRVSQTSLNRFKSSGVALCMAPDKKPTIPAGPWWIWTYLDFTAENGCVSVTSYYAFFNLQASDYGRGNHYCKLLSPARALEWILVDGLRPYSAMQ
jgi:hypothetical protein